MNNQYAKIITYCKLHGFITVRDMVRIGINSPTMRIAEMRRKPQYEVKTDIVRVYDEFGKQKTHYTKYFVKEICS